MRHYKYPFWTCYFLVLLRLTIGWHFLYEGYHKVHSLWVGPTTTNKPFSSAGYFNEAQGPLGPIVKRAIGDADERLLDRLAVQPLGTDQDPANDRKHLRMSVALAREWDDWFERFASQYQLDAQQHAAARVKLEQAQANFVRWFSEESKPFTKTFPSGSVELKLTTQQLAEEFRAKLNSIRDVYGRELPTFGRDVEKARLAAAKQELNQLRARLDADLKEQTALLQKALADVLTDEQRKLGDVPESVEKAKILQWLDVGTAYFLFGVGACLMLGLFTRLSCFLAAAFLLMTYLTAPALPWLPTPPQQEGNYFFVSKNVIELAALLALATTPSGRWFGLDGLIHPMFLALFGRPRPIRNEQSL